MYIMYIMKGTEPCMNGNIDNLEMNEIVRTQRLKR